MNVPFTSPMISEDEIEEAVKVLRSGWIGTGPKVVEFEEKMKKYLGVSNFLAVNSGTAALHLALLASGIGKGDEVITTPLTFAATANVIHHVGAKPVFADIKKDDWNIDPEEIRKKITKKTRAIIVVHLGGMPADMGDIMELAEKHLSFTVIEDAAHAIGAKYDGEMIGASHNLVCFSYYPSKIVTTIEGGAVSTNSVIRGSAQFPEIAAMRLHGQSKYGKDIGTTSGYRIVYPGYKYNMTDVEAAIGIKQLEKIDGFLEKRKKLAEFYLDELKGVKGIQLPVAKEPKKERVWYLFSILLKTADRAKVIEQLKKRGIGTGIHYGAVHLEPFYGYMKGSFPVAEYVGSHTLSIPMEPRISQEQAEYVVSSLKEILRE